MKVLLINIALRPESPKSLFPIGLGYIATAIDNAGYELEILDLEALRPTDDEIENLIKKAKFDVVTLGTIVSAYRYVKKISKMIRKHHPNAQIIAGNTVASSIPEILLNKTEVDIAVFSEGDVTIVELLHVIKKKKSIDAVSGIAYKENGLIKYTKERTMIQELDNLPFINYGLWNMEFYLSKCKMNVPEPYPVEYEKLVALPMNTARGCPFQCTFCYHAFYGKRYRVRPIQKVCDEIKFLQDKYGLNYVQFFDELTLFSKKQAEEFADTHNPLFLVFYWVADCRATLFKDEDLPLLKKLKKAGCVSLGYSLESADEAILTHMNKKIKLADFIEQTRVIKKSGIVPVTAVVLGYPEETVETIKKTFDVCYDAEIYPSTGYLLPQPGTPMYDLAKEMGLIEDDEEYLLKMGDRQDLTINYTSMSRQEMEEIAKTHLRRISDKLNLGLTDVMKTGHYRQKSKK